MYKYKRDDQWSTKKKRKEKHATLPERHMRGIYTKPTLTQLCTFLLKGGLNQRIYILTERWIKPNYLHISERWIKPNYLPSY